MGLSIYLTFKFEKCFVFLTLKHTCKQEEKFNGGCLSIKKKLKIIANFQKIDSIVFLLWGYTHCIVYRIKYVSSVVSIAAD